MIIGVRGIGAVGGFGTGARALALDEGRPGTLTIPWGEGPREIPAWRADLDPLERFMPRRALRRVDRLSRMALLGACLALEDTGDPAPEPGGLGVMIACGHGASSSTFALIDTLIQDGDACCSPIHFANSLHNTPGAHVAIHLGATGPNLTLSLYEDAFPGALEAARLWIEEGRAQAVLVGAVDELSELTGYLRARTDSAGVPGEGAAFLLLSAGMDHAFCGLDEALALPTPDLRTVGAHPGAGAFRLAAALERAFRSSRR
jgi:3-oxoacyl-[acyl-carrier-protein] synthase II